MAMKQIEVSIAYAVWAGLGTVLVATVGILWFREPASPLKIASILMIVLSVIGLHLSGAGQHQR